MPDPSISDVMTRCPTCGLPTSPDAEAEVERLRGRERFYRAAADGDAQTVEDLRIKVERLREALTNVREWCAEQRDYCRPPDMADLDDEELDQRRGPCAAYGAVVYALVIGRIDRAEQKR